MKRRTAWILSAIAVVSLAALVFGVGASSGQFGFSDGIAGADTSAGTNDSPVREEDDDDDERWEDDDDDDEEEEEDD